MYNQVVGSRLAPQAILDAARPPTLIRRPATQSSHVLLTACAFCFIGVPHLRAAQRFEKLLTVCSARLTGFSAGSAAMAPLCGRFGSFRNEVRSVNYITGRILLVWSTNDDIFIVEFTHHA